LIDDIPTGKDDFINLHWITNAIDCGTKEIVSWMISEGATVVFDDDEGFTCLHSAIGPDKPDHTEIIRILIAAGADNNARGTNDYTPVHYAAVRNDIEALIILVDEGADLSIRTRIDAYATALKEAQLMGSSLGIIAYLTEKEA
jgi:ankyrin repeat protein